MLNCLWKTFFSIWDFTLLPNPSTDNVSIQFKEPWTGNVSVYDALGAPLIQQSIQQKTAQTMAVSSLIPGVYVIYFEDDRQIKQSKKLIIH